MFAELAKSHRLPWIPFFLDGVALDDTLMQDDGIHPNAAAQPRLLEQVWPKLEPLLAAGAPRTTGGR
jgi:acyl-CoA thioesterase-1